ncbi:MAG: hypothetical protein C0601_09490 [Candidatus Muiribacterium halophilum]|uniref:Carboxypeptidase regulatory-like domain-containing protein n=1 Tax=Muiribacterium halophilum TaxID=2053465 RepID=A0A2N5ZDF5_MUIH1|nr:MAG: hypothetical protein C0601_09490 [Candidatus Muirbacterium halophilum]
MSESLLTIGFIGAVLIISMFVVMNYFHSTQNRPKRQSTGSVSGVMNTTSGKDLENIFIQVGKVRTDEKFSYTALSGKEGRTFETYTDINGEFEINGIPIGKHWLIIKKRGYKTMLRMVSVYEDKNTKVDDITLS